MPWPTDTAWPTTNDSDYGAGTPRVDSTDLVYARDVNFLYTQTKAFQDFCGNVGDLIGANQTSTQGPGGLSSPNNPASAVGVTLATKDEYLGAGGNDLLQVVDDVLATGAGPTIAARIDENGILETSGGIDIGSTEYLEIPHGNALPATFEEGRLFHKDNTDELYKANGSAWSVVGGGGGGGGSYPALHFPLSAAFYCNQQSTFSPAMWTTVALIRPLDFASLGISFTNVQFGVIMTDTGAVQVDARLYNLTDSEVVTNSLISAIGTSVPTSVVSPVIPVGATAGDLKTGSAKMYEVQLYLNGSSFGPGELYDAYFLFS